jgi:hypothetical protein
MQVRIAFSNDNNKTPRLINDETFRHSSDSRNPTATVKDIVLPLVTEGLMNQGLFVDLIISRRRQKMQMLRLHFSSQSFMTYQQQSHQTECIYKDIYFPVPFLPARKRCQDRDGKIDRVHELIVCKTKTLFRIIISFSNKNIKSKTQSLSLSLRIESPLFLSADSSPNTASQLCFRYAMRIVHLQVTVFARCFAS